MEVKTGALIITAGKTQSSDGFEPMIKAGSVSAVRRLIKTFELAGASPIAVVTESGATSLRRHISRKGVICLENTGGTSLEMLDFAKTGLAYLEARCDQILLTPVDIPFFSVPTVKKLMDCGLPLASPASGGKRGHPLLISSRLIPAVLDYNGENGLRGAFAAQGLERGLVEVDDAGVLLDVELGKDYEGLLDTHNRMNIRPEVTVALARDFDFFTPDAAHLLSLIEETGSVMLACRQTGISYSKAWKLIGGMESQLGYRLVLRQPGGKNGGSTRLSKKAKDILDRFYDFENACRAAAEKLFDEYFGQ